MPVTIAIRFLAGRYHATVWGRHVNDDRPEWPPAPWRLLRALAAVWKQKAHDDPVVNAHIRPTFEKLAGERPEFQLPFATLGHTRHYMPERAKPTLVLDRFVAVDRPGEPDKDPEPRHTVYVHWPVTRLSSEERSALARLLDRMTYLGRAESWCDARLLPERFPVRPNCRPWDVPRDDKAAKEPSEGGEATTPLLIPDPATWSDWSYHPSIKRPDPAWNLLAESADVLASAQLVPPGARWTNYVLPPEAFAASSRAPAPPVQRHLPTVARFVLDGPVLPLVTDTVRVAESFRAAVMSRFGAWCRRHPDRAAAYLVERPGKGPDYASPVLAGKDATGQRSSTHGHAYYLPTAEDTDPRRLTHVTVFARDGFNPDEAGALTGLRRVRVGELELRAQLVGLGKPEDFTAPLFGPSPLWVSATPFVGPAHVGRKGRERYLQKSLRRELRRMIDLGYLPADLELPQVRGLAESSPVRVGQPRAIEYRRGRSRPGDDGYARPFGFLELSFSTPVRGPLVLGYGSHFGLGLFVPAPRTTVHENEASSVATDNR